MPLYDKPQPFRRRQKLGAKDLNKLREAVPRQLRGGPGVSVEQHGDRIIISKDSQPTKHERDIAKFVVKQEYDDWLLCAPLYPDAADPELEDLYLPTPPIHDSDLGANASDYYVYVAKPRLLQRSPWDNQTIFMGTGNRTYNYPGNNSDVVWPPLNDHLPGRREVIFAGGETVIQVIDEPYFAGDVITALFGATGYEDPTFDPSQYTEGERPGLFWQDMNEGARRWVNLESVDPPVDPDTCPCSTDIDFLLTGDSFDCADHPAGGDFGSGNWVDDTAVNVCLRWSGAACIWWQFEPDYVHEGEASGGYWWWSLAFASDGSATITMQYGMFEPFWGSSVAYLIAKYTSNGLVNCSGATTFNLSETYDGGNCALPNTLTLTANACGAPYDPYGGDENCPGERTGLGTNSGKAVTELTGTGINLAAGDTLIVTVAYKGSVSLTVDIDGTNVPSRASDGQGLGFGVVVFALKLTAAVTGGTVTVTASASADVLLMAVDKLVGVANSTGATLTFNANTGTSTAPEAAMGIHTVDACNFLLGLVLTNGPSADADGTWQNNFSDGGQDVGTTGGVDTDNLRLCQGTHFPGVQFSSPVKKTGITSRQWICMWLEWVMD